MANDIAEARGVMARLERLERQNRRMRHIGLGVLVLAGGVLLTAGRLPPGAKSIEAEEIIVRDKQGNRVAILHVTDDGPRLVLFDENEKPRVILKLDKEGPSLCFGDGNGKIRVNLSADKEGSAIGLADDNGRPRVGFYWVKTDGPRILLQDERGKPLFILPPGP
jgi:hypothetical protein